MTDFLNDGILWHLKNNGDNSDASKKISFLPKKKYADINIIAAWALAGVNGIYTHVSYREDKSDMQPELIVMLQSLNV